MDAERLTAAARNIAPNMWHLLETQQAGKLPDGELSRYLTCMNKVEADAVAALLRDYTDPSNYTVDGSRKCWVDGPGIGQETPVEGVWRNGEVSIARYDGQTGQRSPAGGEWRVIQTLRKGFLTTLPYSEAKLVETRTHSGDGATNGQERYVTLEWVGVDPDALDTLSKAKSSADVIDGLQYRKVQHDGSVVIVALGDGWHHLAVTGGLAEDGSGTVRWLVADPEYVLAGFSSWFGSRQSADTYYFNVPEALAQGIIDAAKARGADAGPSGYNDREGLVNIRVSQLDLTGVLLNDVVVDEDCDSVSTASFAWGMGGTNAMRVAGAGYAEVNGIYLQGADSNGKPSYTIFDGVSEDPSHNIIWSANLWVIHVDTIVGIYTSDENVATPDLVSVWSFAGGEGPAPSVSAIVNLPLPIPSSIPAGVSYRREVSERGDGSFSVTLIKRTRKYRDIAEYDTVNSAGQNVKRKEWKGFTDQDLETALDAVPGKIVRVDKSFNDDCSVNIVRDTITPVAQTTTHNSEDSAARSASRTVSTNADAKADAPTAAAGQVTRAQSRENEFGKFNNQVETVTAKAQTTTHTSESRADQTAERVVEQNAAAKKDATAVSGKVVRASSRENKFGRFDNTLETITPTDKVDSGWVDSGQNQYGTIKKRVVVRCTQAEAETAAGEAPTGVYNVTSTISPPDAFGLYQVSSVAMPGHITVSGQRNPYDSYNFDVAGTKKRQHRTKDGNTEKRILTLTETYVGDVDENDVRSVLAGKEGVQVRPNATGTYFQGYGYVVTAQEAWSDDEGTTP